MRPRPTGPRIPAAPPPTRLGARSRRSARFGIPASGASSPSGTWTAAVTSNPSSIRRTRPSDSVRRPPGGEDDRRARGAAHRLPQPVERGVPIGGHVPAAIPHQRRLDPVAPVHPAVVHPAVVADEVAVHLEVGPGPDPDHDLVPGVDADVAALGAAGADAGGLVEVPGARLVQEVLREQRSHRAEIHHVAGPGVVEPLLLGDADVGPIAALGDVEHRRVGHVLHEAHTAGAEDAAVGDVEDVGPEVLHRVVPLGVLLVPGAGRPSWNT